MSSICMMVFKFIIFLFRSGTQSTGSLMSTKKNLKKKRKKKQEKIRKLLEFNC